MSIFPKRSVPGKPVTVHWSIGLESTTNAPMFAFLNLGVKTPDGRVDYLCRKNVLILPKSYEKPAETLGENLADEAVRNNLARNTPILILADYLSGRRKKEELVQILKRIRSSRHFYFTYEIPGDAPLGRYELVSELYIEGERHPSLTAEEDFFYVEKITVNHVKDGIFTVSNPSSEPVPVKIMEYGPTGTSARLHNVPPFGELSVEVASAVAYLLYNEEREVIPLYRQAGKRVLRNQCVQHFEKADGGVPKVYVLFPDSEDAYILEENYLKIWQLADGRVREEDLKAVDGEAYAAMMDAGLMTICE